MAGGSQLVGPQKTYFVDDESVGLCGIFSGKLCLQVNSVLKCIMGILNHVYTKS